MTKTTREIERVHNINTLMYAVSISLFGCILFVSGLYLIHIIYDHYPSAMIKTLETQQYTNYLQMIEKISENCGSTHLVKWKGEWTVFKEVCKEGGYCKYDYIKISDCLK